MARRLKPPLNGVRYCGNANTKEIHDLDNESANCQIDEIINAGHAIPFTNLSTAEEKGYDNCFYCLMQNTIGRIMSNIFRIAVVGSSAQRSGKYLHACGQNLIWRNRGQVLPECANVRCINRRAPWKLV